MLGNIILFLYLYIFSLTLPLAVGGEFGIKGLTDLQQARGISRMRACVEAVLVFNCMDVFDEKLKSDNLYKPFIEVFLFFIFQSL